MKKSLLFMFTVIMCTFFTLAACNDITDEPIVEDKEYTVTVNASPAEGGTVSGGGNYKENINATVSASANQNYTFKGWYVADNRVSQALSYTFKVTENITLTAVFEEQSAQKEDVSISLSNKTATYTGQPIEIGQAVSDPAEVLVTYFYTGIGETTYEESSAAPTDSGTYSVVAKFAGNSEYNAAQSEPVTLTIEKASITITLADITAYRGAAFIVEPVFSLQILQDDITILYTGINDTNYNESETAPVNIGEYTVKVIVADTNNIIGTQKEVTLTIVESKIDETFSGSGNNGWTGNVSFNNNVMILTRADAIAATEKAFYVDGQIYPYLYFNIINLSGEFVVKADVDGQEYTLIDSTMPWNQDGKQLGFTEHASKLGVYIIDLRKFGLINDVQSVKLKIFSIGTGSGNIKLSELFSMTEAQMDDYAFEFDTNDSNVWSTNNANSVQITTGENAVTITKLDAGFPAAILTCYVDLNRTKYISFNIATDSTAEFKLEGKAYNDFVEFFGVTGQKGLFVIDLTAQGKFSGLVRLSLLFTPVWNEGDYLKITDLNFIELNDENLAGWTWTSGATGLTTSIENDTLIASNNSTDAYPSIKKSFTADISVTPYIAVDVKVSTGDFLVRLYYNGNEVNVGELINKNRYYIINIADTLSYTGSNNITFELRVCILQNTEVIISNINLLTQNQASLNEYFENGDNAGFYWSSNNDKLLINNVEGTLLLKNTLDEETYPNVSRLFSVNYQENKILNLSANLSGTCLLRIVRNGTETDIKYLDQGQNNISINLSELLDKETGIEILEIRFIIFAGSELSLNNFTMTN